MANEESNDPTEEHPNKKLATWGKKPKSAQASGYVSPSQWKRAGFEFVVTEETSSSGAISSLGSWVFTGYTDDLKTTQTQHNAVNDALSSEDSSEKPRIPTTTIKPHETDGLSARERAAAGTPSPPAENVSVEAKPRAPDIVGQKVIDSPVNARITLGPHIPNGIFSKGYAEGHNGISCIDIRAGHGGPYAKSVLETPTGEERAFMDINNKVDSAILQVGARGDLHDDFGVAKTPLPRAKGRSFVAMKADDAIISGRRSIVLVTGTDEIDSQGANVDTPGGIVLMAGNKSDEVQPMVKGANLLEALETVIKLLEELNGTVLDITTQQLLFNASVLSHTHISPAGPTAPSIELAPAYFAMANQTSTTTFTSILNNRLNMKKFYFDFLVPKVGNCDKYIASKYNSTN